eukprot:1185802-Prorocentrum_minimum.AAC.7
MPKRCPLLASDWSALRAYAPFPRPIGRPLPTREFYLPLTSWNQPAGRKSTSPAFKVTSTGVTVENCGKSSKRE